MSGKTEILPRSVTINNDSIQSEDPRWLAVINCDASADGKFVYAVKTTGIYCAPSCPSRQPKAENIVYFDSAEDAEQAGFRPCKRCRQGLISLAQFHAQRVAQACRLLEASTDVLTLDQLAGTVGISAYHFHRLFKAHTGVTPKEYQQAQRARRVREKLTDTATVTEAIHAAGYSSDGRFYEASAATLGMTPQAFRSGGRDVRVWFAIAESSLGAILIAESQRGICAILLGDDPTALIIELQNRFPQAELLGGDPDFEQRIASVIGFIEAPQLGLDLPLDIRGTAFQQRVWQALREIPVGSTASYADIARKIGAPKSVRAVAGACAANVLAVAIPCHRVVKTDGHISGYRWGVERKRSLLAREEKS